MLLQRYLVLSDLVYQHSLESGHVTNMFLCYYYVNIIMLLCYRHDIMALYDVVGFSLST